MDNLGCARHNSNKLNSGLTGSQGFKAVIQAYIDEQVATDELFAKEVAKENKNIDDCIKYILSEVKKSGCCGFDNDEIWSMVHHYYTENEVEISEVGNCHIVSNHHVDLTEEEIREAKEKALQNVMREEENRLRSSTKSLRSAKKPKAKKPTEQPQVEQASLFDF